MNIAGRISRRQPSKKRNMIMGTWNITSLTGKEVEIVEEMEKYKIAILGLSETKKKGTGDIQLDKGYTLKYSGVGKDQRAKEGVGIILNKETSDRVIFWEAINSRIIRVDLDLDEKVSLIQIYAPTDEKDNSEKDEFYDELQRILDKARDEIEHVIIMGDWNARIGKDMNTGFGCMGKHGAEEIRNGNGTRMIEFCINNQILIGNTFYPHKNIHQLTFIAEERQARSAIDYFTYTKRTRYAILDVRVFRSAELSTQHKLLIMKTRFRAPKTVKTKRYTKLKIEELNNLDKRQEFKRKIEDKLRENDDQNFVNLESRWQKFKEILLSTTEEVCGKKTVSSRTKHTKWWNEEVKQKVKQKKMTWKKYCETKTREDWQSYVTARNEAKIEVRKAKEQTWEEFGNEIENNFKDNKRKFWTLIKGLRGKTGKRIRNIQDKQNKLITDTPNILDTWREYYEDIFKEEETNEIEEEEDIENNFNENENNNINEIDVEIAIDSMKLGKAAGPDNITPEMIKYGGRWVIVWLRKIFQQAWNEERIPRD